MSGLPNLLGAGAARVAPLCERQSTRQHTTPFAPQCCRITGQHRAAPGSTRKVTNVTPSHHRVSTRQRSRTDEPVQCVDCQRPIAGIVRRGRCRSCYDKHRRRFGEPPPRPNPVAHPMVVAGMKAPEQDMVDLVAKILETGPLPHAACARPGVDPKIFDSRRTADVTAALAICDTCPIRARCARQADARYDCNRNGVLAGRRYLNGKGRAAGGDAGVKTMTAHRIAAHTIAAEFIDDMVSRVEVRCPYCDSTHVHAWTGDPVYSAPCCALATYSVELTSVRRGAA